MSTMTDHFVMLWGDMLASSIIDEDLHVKWAFVICLLLCDQNGDFRATPSYLARTAGMSMEQAEAALEILSAPDDQSTSKDLDGARLKRVGTNLWHVVNYRAYRERKDRHLQREKWAEDKRRQRGTQEDSDGQAVDTSGQGVDPSTSTSTSTSISPSTEKKKRSVRKGEIPFEEFWSEYPRKVGRPKAEGAWRNLTVKDQGAAIGALPDHLRMWSGKELQFIPHPTTWLNQRRWEDVIGGVSAPSHLKAGSHEGEDGANGEWLFETVRRSDRDKYGNHSMWDQYEMDACEVAPKTMPPFSEWLESEVEKMR